MLKERPSTSELAREKQRRYLAKKNLSDPGWAARRLRAWRAKNHERSLKQGRNSYQRHIEKRRAEARAKFQRLKAAGYSDAYRLRDLNRKHKRRLMQGGGRGVNAAEWNAILEAFNHKCAYCASTSRLEQDHVVPLSKGGKHCATNIVPACKSCNSSKGNRPAPKIPVADPGTQGEPSQGGT